ncbi:MAG: alpha/beta hydrolase-fold protein [Planctomycetota bacterium]
MESNELKPGWQQVLIDSHPCQVFLPSTPNEHQFSLLYLHDGDAATPDQMPALSSLLEQHDLPCVAPITGHSWWADRIVAGFDSEITPERFVRTSVMDWILDRLNSKPTEVALLGVGMGGQGALRISYKYPDQFPVVAAVAPDLDYHFHIRSGNEVLYALYGDTESARQDTAILHIHPLNWPRHQFYCADPNDFHTFEGADRLRMKMASTGIMFEVDIETTAKPGENYDDTMMPVAMDFVRERLKKEWLRVV